MSFIQPLVTHSNNPQPDLARQVWSKIIPSTEENQKYLGKSPESEEEELELIEKLPSAFQIRIAGCKGVVVVWPREKMQEVKYLHL